MMHLIRRLLLGGISGVIVASLHIAVINVTISPSSDSLTLSDLGGVLSLIFAGLLIGLSYAWLFYPVSQTLAENVANGLIVGLGMWVILAINIYPTLSGQGPMWEASAIATLIPHLIAYLSQGSFIGLLYGRAYIPLSSYLTPIATPTPPVTQRVVILGGGYAGVNVAQALEQELERDPTVGIWLVSQTNYLLHTPMLSEVSASALNAQHISPPLRNFFRRTQVVQGEVAEVDLEQRVIRLTPDDGSPHRELPFDHLVLTTGGVPNFFGNQAVEAEAFTFKSLEDAVLLRNHIIHMFERADFETDPSKRQGMLTFVVAGGGFAGVELIGGLNDFVRGMLPYYPNVLPDEVRPVLVHSRDTILPELSEQLGKYAQQKLAERGVEFKLGVRVTGAESGAVLLGDEVLPTETFVWTAGNKPSPILGKLGLPLTKRGQVEVNTELAVPELSGVWAAGDCAQIPDLSTGKFCPPTAQHALREGKVLGYNVAAAIKGKPLKQFNFTTLGSLAALGHQLAVAEIMGYRFSGFLAWLMWRAIYLSKLPTVDKQVRVGLDWVLDIFFPPDIVQTIDFRQAKSMTTDRGE